MEPGNEASKVRSRGRRGLHTGNRLRKPEQGSPEDSKGQDISMYVFTNHTTHIDILTHIHTQTQTHRDIHTHTRHTYRHTDTNTNTDMHTVL